MWGLLAFVAFVWLVRTVAREARLDRTLPPMPDPNTWIPRKD